MVRRIEQGNTYEEKLVKLIPAEIVAAFIAIQDLVLNKPNIREMVIFISAIALGILIPFYLWKIHSIRSPGQIVVTVISFFVWVFSISAIFINSIHIDPTWGSVVLILWTMIVPILPFNSPEG